MSEPQTPQGVAYSTLPHFVNSTGVHIYCRYWEPALDEGEKPRAIALMLHGLGGHCGELNNIAEVLAQQKLLVCSHDHAGNGQSQGDRGIISDYHTYIDDALQHLKLIKEKCADMPDVPVFLMGYSMGGSLAILTAVKRPEAFKGVVILSPPVVRGSAKSPITIFFGKIAAKVFPHWHLAALESKWFTRDEEEVKRIDEDPLNYRVGLKLGMGIEVLKIIDDTMATAENVEFPYILLHGEADVVCDIEGSRTFHGKTKSKDKTMKTYEGAYHTLIGELPEVKDAVMKDIVDWINARV